MYTPVVGQPTDPARLRGIEEWIPESLKQYVPTNPATIFVYMAVGIIGLGILFGGGVSTGSGRFKR